MAKNVADKLDKGISPQAFIEGMAKNKDTFQGWMETFTWPSEEDQEFFQSLSFRDDLRCLVVAAEWCGDVVKNVPVVFRALESTEMPVEVYIMEEHTDLLDQFLTFGARAIPIVIFADTGGHVLGVWGPRPDYVQQPMAEFKKRNLDVNAPDYDEQKKQVYTEIKERYGEGTEYHPLIVKELREILSGV